MFNTMTLLQLRCSSLDMKRLRRPIENYLLVKF